MGAAERLPYLYSEAEAAEYLGVSEVTMARIRKRGDIGHTMIARRPKYTESHLLDYLEQQTCPRDSALAPTGSSNAKARPSGIALGGTATDASSALRLAHETLNRQKSS